MIIVIVSGTDQEHGWDTDWSSKDEWKERPMYPNLTWRDPSMSTKNKGPQGGEEGHTGSAPAQETEVRQTSQTAQASHTDLPVAPPETQAVLNMKNVVDAPMTSVEAPSKTSGVSAQGSTTGYSFNKAFSTLEDMTPEKIDETL
eukprot:5473521-Amphidinium_carterae.1